jgi:hypothetical protein
MKCRQWVVDVILKQTPSRLQRFEARNNQFLVIVSRGFRQIDASQQHENIRLYESDADVQALENNRHSERDQRKENQRHHFSREHVRE